MIDIIVLYIILYNTLAWTGIIIFFIVKYVYDQPHLERN